MSNKRQKLKKGEIDKQDIVKTSKLERLSAKIVHAFPHKNEDGKIYVNFCSYPQHPGIIGDKKFENYFCKDCKHYKRLTEE